MQKRAVVLRCDLSPGDIVMLTAAVRDLHFSHPDHFLTDVRTRCPQIWEHNPFITPLDSEAAGTEVIECSYPLINDANRLPYHCLHGFRKFLSDKLRVQIRPTKFAGDIHLSPLEKSWMSQVHELTGRDIPFWIIVAGGKFDIPIKWWDAARFQRVIDHFRGTIQFVQVGQRGDYHPPLRGVIDLRGKTDLRQLIRLTYHAQGVVCPVTCLMHMAAAVETKPGLPIRRPGVVIAGGREPTHWEAYPHHQFIHTIGSLACCATAGCWKAHVHPPLIRNGTEKNICVDVTGNLPRCMDMISAEEVIQRVELYFKGGVAQYLTPEQAAAGELAIEKTRSKTNGSLSVFIARFEAEEFIRKLPTAPASFNGRGIIIPAGGPKYLPCAWVCVNMLRELGCTLPMELWHLGAAEMPASFATLIEKLGVACIDAHQVRKKFPARWLNGWELKSFSLLHTRFQEVLLLDADNVPVANPEFLFCTPQFKEAGANFWPDHGRLAPTEPIWKLCGVEFQDEPEFESGQILVDKARCWKALRLALWYNEHSDFFYHHIYGDKDTFHMAFRKLNAPYAMPDTPMRLLDGVMCQHDFQGRRIFQHRNMHKWTADTENPRVEDFWFENDCLRFLVALRESNALGPTVTRSRTIKHRGRVATATVNTRGNRARAPAVAQPSSAAGSRGVLAP